MGDQPLDGIQHHLLGFGSLLQVAGGGSHLHSTVPAEFGGFEVAREAEVDQLGAKVDRVVIHHISAELIELFLAQTVIAPMQPGVAGELAEHDYLGVVVDVLVRRGRPVGLCHLTQLVHCPLSYIAIVPDRHGQIQIGVVVERGVAGDVVDEIVHLTLIKELERGVDDIQVGDVIFSTVEVADQVFAGNLHEGHQLVILDPLVESALEGSMENIMDTRLGIFHILILGVAQESLPMISQGGLVTLGGLDELVGVHEETHTAGQGDGLLVG